MSWSFFIDRGGTFTDCIGVGPKGEVRVTKVLSSDEAPLIGMRRLLGLSDDARLPPLKTVRMGTTVATNALLERRGAPTTLVVSKGFEDALRIGTQARPEIFALEVDTPAPLAEAVVGVDLRLDAEGQVRAEPGWQERLVHDLEKARRATRSVAVVLLNGHLDPAPEQAIEDAARGLGFEHVSISSRVAPEIGLVGRGDTTLVDAYLTPLLTDYVATLQDGLRTEDGLLIMQSSGGLCAAEAFRGRDAVLSGPAGGVVAARACALAAGVEQAIAFDMGGTSTDVSRVEAHLERSYETEVAGVRLRAPMLDIHTVAAGGGSLCRLEGARLTVGPESAGAVPGPLCYGHPDAEEVALTDVNLVLGRLRGERFPFPLDRGRARAALEFQARSLDGALASAEAVAEGYLEVAHEVMAQAIRQVSVARGHDVREHALVVFGGAGGQHAAALAERLDIDTVLFPPFSGVLSALGMALAEVDTHRVRDLGRVLLDEVWRSPGTLFDAEETDARAQLRRGGVPEGDLHLARSLDLSYRGTETTLNLSVELSDTLDTIRDRFERAHERQFGFRRPEHEVVAAAARLEVRGGGRPAALDEPQREAPAPCTAEVYVDGAWRELPTESRERLVEGTRLEGPALVLEATGTIFVGPGFTLEGGRTLVMRRVAEASSQPAKRVALDPVRLEVYNHRYMAIAERMGLALRRTAHSVNIRERLDFSCAVFDSAGELVANAPHIPVHLGAMSETVKTLVRTRDMAEGDVFVTNDPSAGGSHLPDITVVTPVFIEGTLRFFTASRGHHEDVGGITPGSMPPFSKHLDEEGVVLRGLHLVRGSQPCFDEVKAVLQSGPHPARRPDDNLSDLRAQAAANTTGASLLEGLVAERGSEEVEAYMGYVQADAARRVGDVIEALADGTYPFEDALDDGHPVAATLRVSGRHLTVDFSGTGPASTTNLNAPRAVTVAATLYVLRSMVGAPIPLNSGCLDPVRLSIPKDSLLDPPADAPVAGGNVETSQRVVDVLLGALGRAAASQGTMNNLTFGDASFGYYETIAGGMGATPIANGRSGIHSHMTNTRITDPEVLEARFPVRVVRFGLRTDSGGAGRHRGGDGVIRELEALAPLRVSILSERRTRAPFGLEGGAPGAPGRNFHGDSEKPGKTSFDVARGDRFRIETPGGGGFGKVP